MSPLWPILWLTIGAPPAPAPVIPPALVEAPPGATVAARRDTSKTVQVEFTVDATGAVTDPVVVAGHGPPWDGAALTMIRRTRFQPATQAGVAIATRATAPVTVGGRRWRSEAGPRRPIEPVPRVADGISGTLRWRGRRNPAPGMLVQLTDSVGTREAVTDAKGAFEFPDLPVGTYVLEIAGGDDFTPREVQPPATLDLRMTPDPALQYRTVVRREATSQGTARIVIPVDQARQVAGSSGDPVKVVESLPGVARPNSVGPSAGQLSVRGSAPEDTRFVLDGMPLFQLFHFGGLYSVLQDAWIQDIDFRAGDVPVAYGNSTGGLLGVRLADLPTDGVHGHLDINTYHAAVLVTAAPSESWSVGAAFRRNYFDVVLKAVAGDGDGFRFTTAPRYYDYQVRADWRPSPQTSLRLIALGSDDELSLVTGDPPPDSPADDRFQLRRFFHQLQGRLTHAFSPTLTLEAGLSTSYQRFELAPLGDRLKLTFDPVTLRADLEYRPSASVRARGGVLFDATRFDVRIDLPRPLKEGEVALPGASRESVQARETGVPLELGLWSDLSVRPGRGVTLSGGARLTSWLGEFSAVRPDVRLGATWDVTEHTRLTASGSLRHQAPQPDETAPSIGNPELSPERAWSATVGVTQALGSQASLDGQLFYKALVDLVSPTGDFGGVPYDNAGRGTVFGAELLVRWDVGWLDGWMSYTLSRSVRTDRPGAAERPFSFDQTHVLAVVAGVDLGRRWRLGTRLRYSTGNPFTPLVASHYDASSDVFVPRADAAPLSRRIRDVFQLDLRLDKRWIFDDWEFTLYVELQNATNQENVEAVGYTFDYRAREDVVGLPIVPAFGLRGSF